MATIDIDNQPLVPPPLRRTAALRSRLPVRLAGRLRRRGGVAGRGLLGHPGHRLVLRAAGRRAGALLAAVAIGWAAVVVERIGRRAFVRISDSNAATVLGTSFPATERQPADGRDARPLTRRSGRNRSRAACPDLPRGSRPHGSVDVRKAFNPRPLRRNCGAAGLLRRA